MDSGCACARQRGAKSSPTAAARGARASPPRTAILVAAARGEAGRLGKRGVEQVFASGWSAALPLFVVRAVARGDGGPSRVSAVAGKRLGGAVARNRARRRLAEAARLHSLPRGLDVVFVARAGLLGASPAELAGQVASAVEEVRRRSADR